MTWPEEIARMSIRNCEGRESGVGPQVAVREGEDDDVLDNRADSVEHAYSVEKSPVIYVKQPEDECREEGDVHTETAWDL